MLAQDAIHAVFERLHDRYHQPESDRRPHVKEEAEHFRALVACLLSAQSRDSNTAKAKAALFQLADTPEGILALPDDEVAAAIKPCGLYNAKTRNLKRLAAAVREMKRLMREALTLDLETPSSETGYVVLELRGGQVG